MGKAKLKLELIGKERSRMLTFKKRKQGLLTKLHQLTTLCGVNACMIIHGPKQEHGAIEPEIWPQNPDEVRRIIGLYEAKNRGKGSSSSSSSGNNNPTFGLSDFFHERKRKIEKEIVKLKRKNKAAKYQTPSELLDLSTEGELREFGALLKNKADIVKSRIEFLKRNRGGLINQKQSHDFGVFYQSTATMGDPGIFWNSMPVAQYSVPPMVQPLPPLYVQCAAGMGGAPPPLYFPCFGTGGLPSPLHLQCIGMGGLSPPQMQFPASETSENDDGGLEDILRRAAGMGVMAPGLYLQCAGMNGVAPPPLRENFETDGGLADIFRYI